ncbi:hypothetical protein PIB30_087798, partial [Stylosanthes scabra]|nr:hypothetical protein [Stylosanthes scabra]
MFTGIPTQEVIDISSNSEDEHEPQSIKVVVPKIEDCFVTSPSSKLITEVLMRMGQELSPESQPDPSVPSFSLGKEFQRPLRTQEQPRKTSEEEPLQLETPQPTQMIKNDLEERVANWETVAKGDNNFNMIFKLRGHRFLKAMRCQFMSMVPWSYIDIQVVSLMCHVINTEENEQFEKL